VTDRSPAGRRAAVLVTLAVALLAGGGGFTGATLSDTERAGADWTAGTWTEAPPPTSTSTTTANDATTTGTSDATTAEATTASTDDTTAEPTTASTPRTDTTTTDASGSTPPAHRSFRVGVDGP
jgi:hypothetical protein